MASQCLIQNALPGAVNPTLTIEILRSGTSAVDEPHRRRYDAEQVRRFSDTTIAYLDQLARTFWNGTRDDDVSQNYAAFPRARRPARSGRNLMPRRPRDRAPADNPVRRRATRSPDPRPTMRTLWPSRTFALIGVFHLFRGLWSLPGDLILAGRLERRLTSSSRPILQPTWKLSVNQCDRHSRPCALPLQPPF